MGLGSKRHLVTLQTRSSALDSHGEDVLTYTTLATAWAEIKAVSSSERLESQQIKAEISHTIAIRYAASYAGIGAEDRIVYGSRTFDIVAPVDPDGRSRELEFTVKERL